MSGRTVSRFVLANVATEYLQNLHIITLIYHEDAGGLDTCFETRG